MRILHLTDHYPPVLGGIETHVAALAHHQAGRGDDVTVLTSTSSTADGQHLDDAGPVTVRRVRSVVEGRAVDFGCFDVVHAHISVVAPFSAPLAALVARRGVPTIVTVHSLWNGMGPIPAAAASITGLRTAPVMWSAVSRVAADQLGRRLPQETQVRVLPNAVEVAARRRTPSPRSDRSVRLVSTMRIARRKRPLQLLRMFESLRRSVSVPVELTIVGDGPLRARLEQHLRRAGLTNAVTVTGRVDPSAVLGVLAESDLYVAPAVLESFGLAALEARCVGLPVVGHAASGMTEFVRDGVEGALCRSDADMVSRLQGLVVDGALRQTISEHNRTVSSPLTWANTLNHHDAAYALACPARPTSSAKPLGSVARG
ncbi:MAG: glycosyltransferase family 4 protein [Marmoricola sp.]